MAKKKTIWDKQKRIAIWPQKSAVRLANKLMPLIGQRVVLYGGGGIGSRTGKLVDVRVEIPKYYGRSPDEPKVYIPQDDFVVKIKLVDLEPAFGVKRWYDAKGMFLEKPIMERIFEPSLGSWMIAAIKGRGKRRKMMPITNPMTEIF